jgi:hypothetical protein
VGVRLNSIEAQGTRSSTNSAKSPPLRAERKEKRERTEVLPGEALRQAIQQATSGGSPCGEPVQTPCGKWKCRRFPKTAKRSGSSSCAGGMRPVSFQVSFEISRFVGVAMCDTGLP